MTQTTEPGTGYQPRAELAPSETRDQAPTIARVAGTIGLFFAAAGVVSVIASWFGRGLFSEAVGYLIAVFGLAGLFFHATRDSDQEVRRVYGALATFLMILALASGVATIFGADQTTATGAEAKIRSLLPFLWPVAGLLGLVFATTYARHETEEPFAAVVRYTLLGVGTVLALGAVGYGLLKADFLVGPAPILALLGLGYLSAFLSREDTSAGLGFWVAVGLGVLGAVALAVALGRSVVPTVLHEGPAALRDAARDLDPWRVVVRVAAVLIGLGIASVSVRRGTPLWLRGVSAVLGLAIAVVFIVGSFAAPMTTLPAPYLVPYGLILGGIGAIYLAVSLAVCTDYPVVVLTRRELAAYFFSPIAYIVLFVMAVATGLGYWLFLSLLYDPRGGGAPEPILQEYLPGTFIGPLLVPFLVPALTMRLFSEEKRTGTLEVLLTAPVSEWAVVLSKFVACWLFYMLSWTPAGLYLIGLRVEGGQPFDYRPLLSFYLAVGVTGAAFIAIGMFFSSLTRNQIVAAVMTFVVLLTLMVIRWNDFFLYLGKDTGPVIKAAMGRLSYWLLWTEALRGQLPLRDVLIQASVAVFGVVLTAKILEARKWS